MCFILASRSLLFALGEVGAVVLRGAMRGVALCCVLLVSRLDVCGVANPYVSNGFSECAVFVREVLFLYAAHVLVLLRKKKLACVGTLVKEKKRLRTSVSCV